MAAARAELKRSLNSIAMLMAMRKPAPSALADKDGSSVSQSEDTPSADPQEGGQLAAGDAAYPVGRGTDAEATDGAAEAATTADEAAEVAEAAGAAAAGVAAEVPAAVASKAATAAAELEVFAAASESARDERREARPPDPDGWR